MFLFLHYRPSFLRSQLLLKRFAAWFMWRRMAARAAMRRHMDHAAKRFSKSWDKRKKK